MSALHEVSGPTPPPLSLPSPLHSSPLCRLSPSLTSAARERLSGGAILDRWISEGHFSVFSFLTLKKKICLILKFTWFFSFLSFPASCYLSELAASLASDSEVPQTKKLKVKAQAEAQRPERQLFSSGGGGGPTPRCMMGWEG